MIGIIIGSICGAILLAFILLFLMCELTFRKVFFQRSDGDVRIRYAPISEELDVESVSFKNNKKATLNGFIYKKKGSNSKRLVIVSHGLGAGHAYLRPLINYLANKGFAVFAYDNYASSLSEGKVVTCMSQAIIDLKYAIEYITSRKQFSKNTEINLLGHSWGGFAVLNALNFKDIKINKIVSFAGFDNDGKFCAGNSKFLRAFSFVITLRNALYCGKYAFYSASKGLKLNKDTKVYYLQGKLDETVNPKDSGYVFEKINNPNLKVEMLDNKYHSPFIADSAEKEAMKVLKDFGIFGGGNAPLDTIYYENISTPDMEIYQKVLNFLN